MWDKSASIRFRRPGRAALHARFSVAERSWTPSTRRCAIPPRVDRVYPVDLVDRDGVVHATVEKTIHIRRRDADRSSR